MADLKPAYLIHGDDEVKLDAWRARVRERAAREGALLEVVHGDRDSGEEVALALSSLTLSMGRRYLLVDGLERWKDKDVAPVAAALASPAPDTVVVLIGTRPAGKKWSPPAKLTKAVEKGGGEVTECAAPRAAGLPGWVAERGKELGLVVDREAARALVDRVGADQRRLMRELEKIACYAPDAGRVSIEVVEQLTAPDVEAKAYELADAVIQGDRALALRLAEDLRDRDQDMMRILYAMLRRAHDMRRAWAVVEAGGSTQDVHDAVGGPPWLAKRIASEARNLDGERLERIAAGLADLDYAIRGGGNRDIESALTLTLAA